LSAKEISVKASLASEHGLLDPRSIDLAACLPSMISNVGSYSMTDNGNRR